jgi:hypothetical protein
MKRFITLTATMAFLFAITAFSFAQDTPPPAPPVVHGPGFVDLNGDGINDNAPDHDGDGIPNGQDPDYIRLSTNSKGFVDLDGDGINDNFQDADGDGIPNGQDPDYAGAKTRSGKGSRGFVDMDGDGINDNMGSGLRSNRGKGRGGFGNGTGLAPADGTGLGQGATSGSCDLTGPKGQGRRGGRGRTSK